MIHFVNIWIHVWCSLIPFWLQLSLYYCWSSAKHSNVVNTTSKRWIELSRKIFLGYAVWATCSILQRTWYYKSGSKHFPFNWSDCWSYCLILFIDFNTIYATCNKIGHKLCLFQHICCIYCWLLLIRIIKRLKKLNDKIYC